ncbi:hypothetical protein AA313_de0202486 [Arthrobotrys entomopaga]|nr:hypothetical protein AA313_de0202486 [Arthrobotrys entomopaga]
MHVSKLPFTAIFLLLFVSFIPAGLSTRVAVDTGSIPSPPSPPLAAALPHEPKHPSTHPPTSRNHRYKTRLLRRADEEGEITTHLQVVCSPAEVILDGLLARQENDEAVRRVLTPLLRDRDRDAAILYIKHGIGHDCERCLCDDSNPVPPGGRARLIGVPAEFAIWGGTGCQEHTARFCEDVYGCYCAELMWRNGRRYRPIKPPTTQGEPSTTAERVKQMLEGRRWMNARSSKGKGVGDQKGTSAGVEKHRSLAPGTKEPYWLEGPDVDLRPDLNFLSGLGSGIGGGLFKRDDDGGDRKTGDGDRGAKDAPDAPDVNTAD